MATARSSSTGYADSDDLIARYDVRTIREYASDEDARVTAGSLSTNDRVTAALLGASGEVEAAVTIGGRYIPDDLDDLTGSSLAFLKDLVCALAMGRLFLSRPDRKGEPPQSVKDAREMLVALSEGAMVFGLVENQDAGKVDVETETAAVVEARNGVVYVASPYFGRRNNRRHE